MRVLIGILLSLLATRSLAAACPDYVARFTPEVIRDTDTAVTTSCKAFTIGGHALVAVVYSNGTGASLVVVDPSAEPVRAVESPANLFGVPQSIDLRPLRAGGPPALFVRLLARQTEELWIFSVDEHGAPHLISPSAEDGGLTEPTLIDVDGNGVPSIIDMHLSKEYDEEGLSVVTPTFRLFSFSGGVYKEHQDRTVFAFRRVFRQTGDPTPEDIPVDVPESGLYRITMLNGAGDPSLRCSAAMVTVNETKVFGADDFKKQQAIMTTTGPFTENSVLHVELRGKPDCAVDVLVDQPK